MPALRLAIGRDAIELLDRPVAPAADALEAALLDAGLEGVGWPDSTGAPFPLRSKRPTVCGSASSPGSSSSSPCADSGGAMSSRSRWADSTPIVAWMMPPTIITIAPTR